MVVPATGAAGGRERASGDASCDGWQLIISIEMLARAEGGGVARMPISLKAVGRTGGRGEGRRERCTDSGA